MDWRYIEEEEDVPKNFEFRATFLSLAARSVLEVANFLPILQAEPKYMSGLPGSSV